MFKKIKLKKMILKKILIATITTLGFTACSNSNTAIEQKDQLELKERTASIVLPEMINFGSSLDDTLNALNSYCSEIKIQKNHTDSPLAIQSQRQINCANFSYAGKYRSMELVFNDNQLDIVWILIPTQEQTDIINKFNAEIGSPSMIIDYGAIYLQANAAIRKSPSEVLFASERQKQLMLKQLKK